MEQLNPNDLLIYARVAEAGSISQAAQRLGLPKSTVSRRLALLEDQLGERLMVRSTRRSSFTEFGLQLLEHARQVAAEVDAVVDLRAHRQAQPSGRLRVSMPSEVAVMLAEDMLPAFASLHPAVTLEMDLSARRVDLLSEGFDLALRFGDLPDDATLVARKLATLSVGLYAAPAYLAQHGEPETPQDLLRHQALLLLRRNREPMPWSLRSEDAHWQGSPPSSFAANSPELLLHMAMAGKGIVAVLERFATPHVQTRRLRRVLPGWSLPADTAWAVVAGRRLMPPKTRAFIDMLQVALGHAAQAPIHFAR